MLPRLRLETVGRSSDAYVPKAIYGRVNKVRHSLSKFPELNVLGSKGLFEFQGEKI